MDKPIIKINKLIEQCENFKETIHVNILGNINVHIFEPEYILTESLEWQTFINDLDTYFNTFSDFASSQTFKSIFDKICNIPIGRVYEDNIDKLIVELKALQNVVFLEIDKKFIQQKEMEENMMTNKVFIVHGRDEDIRDDIELFIRRIGLDPIILCNKADINLAIFDNLEKYTDVSFAIVLYTPCDLGKYKDEPDLKPRARQNVVFEHGYLIHKLGRENVVALIEPGIEMPSDLSGMLHVSLSERRWEDKIIRYLKKCNIPFNAFN